MRIDLAYDGSGFHGFAAQDGHRTVEGELAAALERLAGPVSITVAGRTDAGVHARAQTVHVDVPTDARLLGDVERARRALDRMLGPEITIWRVRVVPATFDARFSATERRYRYWLCDGPALDPLDRIAVWHVGPPALDVAAMNAGGRHLIGEHDFASFCRRRGDQHLVRRVDALRVRRRPRGLVELHVAGPAFCHQMVRSIAGCLLRVGRGARGADWVAEALAARDRQVVGQVAPPHGLVLEGVSYGGRRTSPG
ncbi:tRNA pseudouridine(38-40) synthase TruA [Egibacter rhizosphaerae]|uniref:tRNA pseudouridine(38-40) synthase TruA n=1 Tax=Egibacter rhizosphaerae TaxID=1670831 RepID=UPI00197AD2B3|nr:tRNA pseudouridine(38-40) synthase TruA [Egibacter rhizosphaerae]